MNKFVLIACEESQRVCIEFRKLGFFAYSCDIVDCSGGHPEWHIKDDVLNIINGNCTFYTCDGSVHSILGSWDLIIAHPPCTRLCNSGQRWLYYGSDSYRKEKIIDQKKAIDFFFKFVNCNCEHVAIENPLGIMSTLYRKPDCFYNPYDFYPDTECKKTCLWLKNLPPLVSTQFLDKNSRTHNIWEAKFNGKQYAWNNKEVARLRSQTPIGVARAMASQWSKIITE